jgi:hypothetical protein
MFAYPAGALQRTHTYADPIYARWESMWEHVDWDDGPVRYPLVPGVYS